MSNKASREVTEVKVHVDYDPCLPLLQLNPNNSFKEPLLFTQKDEVAYSTIITLGNCPHLGNTKIWSLYRVDKETGLPLEHITVRGLKTKDVTSLEYPPWSLKNGFYELFINVTMKQPSSDGNIRTNGESTYFQIKPAEVFVSLFHYQSEISIGIESNFVISPQSYSIDNNWPSLKLKPVTAIKAVYF